ncbi:MAG: exodeoxyribonuclease VII large subunit [Rubrivivax sp.]
MQALLLATGDALSARFGAVAVRGELSGFSRAPSGHCYFSLKDGSGHAAVLRCAMFRRVAGMLDFAPRDGQQVELRGRLGVYEARGELQMVVESLQRVGAGSLYEEFLRLKARLEAAGLFDSGRKRPLPAMPRALGVVTSLGAAALHDVLTTLRRRAPHVPVVLYPSLVQGTEAPAALVAALALANQRQEVDTVLLVRGGGALEDLWAFNDERVVRAVAESRLPVVCGVGHETDLTLADLAADLRAPTPTAAAELAAPATADLLAALDGRQVRLAQALQRQADRQAQRLDTLALRLGRPAGRVLGQMQHLESRGPRLRQALHSQTQQQAQRLAHLAGRLQRAAAVQLQAAQAGLSGLGGRLQALDPQQVLHRGYAWVEDAAGRPVVSATGLVPGQAVQAVWSDGRAQVLVQAVQAAQPGSNASPRRAGAAKPPAPAS